MTREEAKQFLATLGVSEPTDEQVTTLLNKTNSEVANVKAKAQKSKDADKEELARLREIEEQFNSLQDANKTELEKSISELDKANKRIEELEKASFIASQKSLIADKFKLSGDEIAKVVLEDGSVDYDALSQITSEREVSAANAREKELLDKTPNPQGAGSGKDTKTEAEKVAEAIGKNLSGVNEKAESVVESYL